MAYTGATNIAWNYKRTPRTEIACTNCLAGSLDIYTDKTPVPDSSALSAHPSINKKPYYNNGLSLNESINLTNISL